MSKFARKKIGIDLGTTSCLVYVVGQGVVLQEPAVVAVGLSDNKVLAVGKEAEGMFGRAPDTIRVSKPMRDGVIADYAITESMLRFFLNEVGSSWLWKSDIVICVPAGVTQVEKRAVRGATLAAGARRAYLIIEPLVAAIGAGVPIFEPSGNMILDMGGGASEAVIISLGGVVAFKSVRVAGNKIDESIAKHIRLKHNLVIGDETAEKIKLGIGSAMLSELKGKGKKMEVTGRDSVTGLPKQISVGSGEVAEVIKEPLKKISGMVKSVLELVPPELSSDIIDKGIVMTGGTAQLSGLDKFLMSEIGVPIFVAEDPVRCVIKGTGKVLEDMEKYKSCLLSNSF